MLLLFSLFAHVGLLVLLAALNTALAPLSIDCTAVGVHVVWALMWARLRLAYALLFAYALCQPANGVVGVFAQILVALVVLTVAAFYRLALRRLSPWQLAGVAALLSVFGQLLTGAYVLAFSSEYSLSGFVPALLLSGICSAFVSYMLLLMVAAWAPVRAVGTAVRY